MPQPLTLKLNTTELSEHTSCEYDFNQRDLLYINEYMRIWNAQFTAEKAIYRLYQTLIYKWRQTFYHTSLWDRLRRFCLKRDGYVCRTCKSAVPLAVHHIKAMKDGGSPFNTDNMMSLCQTCHDEEDRHIRETRHEKQYKNAANHEWTKKIDQEVTCRL